MSDFPKDIYTEPYPVDVDTLKNLGPLTAMAGIWEGERGLDVKPKAEGPKKQAYVERIGPQLLYGLRYQVHVTKPDQVKTYHDQVGYWLWEPATQTVIHTLTIPRGQALMAGGTVAPDAKEFELVARQGDPYYGINSNPFLEHAFKTIEFRIKVFINDDGTWGYDEDTVMLIQGQTEPFHHTDRNILRKVGEPTPNPLALAAQTAGASI